MGASVQLFLDLESFVLAGVVDVLGLFSEHLFGNRALLQMYLPSLEQSLLPADGLLPQCA